MAHELVYTSAARGLRDGTSGFCTVAMTRGLPLTLVPRLETLGGYRPGPAGDGPVALSRGREKAAACWVCSSTRWVGPAAPDHTQRSNKIATTWCWTKNRIDGPAWLLVLLRCCGLARTAGVVLAEQPAALPTAPATGPAPRQAGALRACRRRWLQGKLASSARCWR
ncbi:MAG: hypothetical protein U0636_00450 [Phycisphaerales bacterium]